MKFMILAALALFLPQLTWSQAPSPSKGELKPLLFKAEKNNLEVLPQRFEYSLWDEDRLSVGDILIDSTQVTFHLEPSKEKKDQYMIRFTWPAGLLREGQLAIKNNSGKAIFSTDLSKESVKILRGTPMEDHENLRSDIASYTVPAVTPELIEDMKYLPFMVFCVYRETEGTRLYLCSKELYLSSQQGKLTIKPRNTGKKIAQVEINGAPVSNQGIIYLNDSNNSVNFKSRTGSGSSLEIETRKKDVDFKDIIEENGQLVLTAAGAEPVSEENVKKISATEWQVRLPKERPIVFLKGEGDIPMRQEFNIRGPLPQEKDRPYLAGRAPSKTYQSSLLLRLKPAEGTHLKADPTDKSTRIDAQTNGYYRWSLRDLPTGEQRRFVKIESGKNIFTAGFETQRGTPFAASLGANYQAPAGLMAGTAQIQWWLESLFYSNANWSRLHWGLALHHQQHMNDKTDYVKADFTTAELLWRAEPGFNMIDETWGLSLPLQVIHSDIASVTAYGVGAFWQTHPQAALLTHILDWSELKFQYLFGSTGSDFKLSNAYRVEAQAYKKFSDRSNWYFNYGLVLSQYKYQPTAPKEDMQAELDLSVLLRF